MVKKIFNKVRRVSHRRKGDEAGVSEAVVDAVSEYMAVSREMVGRAQDTLAKAAAAAGESKIFAEASDYGQLRAELKKHGEPDVLVMDVGLPGKNGIEILKSLREEYPRLKVLMVSMYPEDQYAVRAFRAGAFGYLNKGSAPEKLLFLRDC